MSTSQFDSFRPPDRRRRRRSGADTRDARRRDGGRGGPGGGRGGGRRDSGGMREAPVVPDAEFSSYYGRPIVKPAPWEDDVAAYLFLGGLGAGSALLAAGAALRDNAPLRRTTRYSALVSAGLGTVALIRDLGRPARFLHMLRTFKITSPMSVGSWILVAFSTGAGLAAAGETDRVLQERWGSAAPLGRLRGTVRVAESAGGLAAGVLAPGLAAYTAVLLTNTATPTWSGARGHLPFVFAGSASLAAGGLAMILTPTASAGPARRLAVVGTAVELLAAELMDRQMDPTEVEPLRRGGPGRMLSLSRSLAIAGVVGTVLAAGAHDRRWRSARILAAVSGASLVASSALNRLGVFRAGIASAKDPRYTVEPQKRRLARRRSQGIVDDSITGL